MFFVARGLFMPGAYLMMLLCFLLFMSGFEGKRISTEEMVLISALSAAAAAGRVLFAAVPSVQPLSFFVICAASVFGGQTGMMVGVLAAFASNLFLGQGPWTPWQMLSWGLMGLAAGFLFHRLKIKSRFAKLFFGLASGILFGWLMNLWYLISFVGATASGFWLAYSQSAYMDLMHGLGNVFFLFFFAGRLEKILLRAKTKYGILR